jgi:hypothetical protein
VTARFTFLADDVAVFDNDVHVLNPGDLNVAQGLCGTSYALSDGLLEAGETALSSVTLADPPVTGHHQAKGASSERMSASEMMPTSRSPSTTRIRSSSCWAIS